MVLHLPKTCPWCYQDISFLQLKLSVTFLLLWLRLFVTVWETALLCITEILKFILFAACPFSEICTISMSDTLQQGTQSIKSFPSRKKQVVMAWCWPSYTANWKLFVSWINCVRRWHFKENVTLYLNFGLIVIWSINSWMASLGFKLKRFICWKSNTIFLIITSLFLYLSCLL